jgi:hypothetical protein
MTQIKLKIGNILSNNKYEIYILLFTFLFLTPIVKCGFISDDGIYYFLRGYINYSGNDANIINITYNNIVSWITRGRFFPFAAYALPLMYILVNNLLYKTAIIIMICINVGMFGSFVEVLTGSKRVKLILMLYVSLFFQIIAVYHSPFLSFSLFMQIMFAILMLILINLQKYFISNSKKHITLSIIFFSVGLMTYELGFSYIGIVILLILFNTKNILQTIKLSIIYFIPLVLVGIINIIIKMRYAIGYEGVAVKLAPLNILKTILKQCYAAFPLSNYIAARNNGILKNDLISIVMNITAQDVLITVMFLIISYSIIKNTDEISLKINNIYFFLFGLAFYICPGVLSSLTQKYQSELYYGVAHISVYIQYFGLLLLFLWLYVFLYYKLGSIKYKYLLNWVKYISLIVVTIVILLNQQNARLYIDNANSYWKYPKEAVQNALELDILSDLSDEDTLSVLTPYAWESNEFYSEFARKKINYIPIETLVHNEIVKSNNLNGLETLYPDKAYVIRYYGNKEEQKAFLGKVQSIYVNSETNDIINIIVSDLKTLTNNKNNSYLLYQSIDDLGESENNITKFEDLGYVNYDGANVVYQLKTNKLIDFNTVTYLQYYTKPLDRIGVIYKTGVSGKESDGNRSWQWCEKNAEISLLNTTSEDIDVQISLTVSNLLQEMSNLDINYVDIHKSLQYNSLGNSIVINMTLNPGENTFTLSTDAPRVSAPNDPRVMHFMINNFSVIQVKD